MKVSTILLAILGALAGVWIIPVMPAVADSAPCYISATDGTFQQQQGVIVDGLCISTEAAEQRRTAIEYRTVGCTETGHIVNAGREQAALCPAGLPRCQLLADGGMSGTALWAYLVQYRQGSGPWLDGEYWCPQSRVEAPAPDATTLRDQVIRLLPEVGIGTTDDHVSLVNVQMILWADTGLRRDLGTVVVTGRTVWLRVDFDSARWDFGDGSSDIAPGPGKPYDRSRDPCAMKQCPDYYGHAYLVAGPMAVQLRVSWHASWSLDGTRFAPVGGSPITGPAATYAVTVMQAKGVLVAND